MIVFAIDPGPEQSAWCRYGNGASELYGFGKEPNAALKTRLIDQRADVLVVEMIASYGMPVGAEVFDTCVWIGRFVEAWSAEHALVFRREVKVHLCADSRAKDANIRQALIDRFGPGKDKAIGTKKQPGPLYGVTADVWSALALAVTYADRAKKKQAATSSGDPFEDALRAEGLRRLTANDGDFGVFPIDGDA